MAEPAPRADARTAAARVMVVDDDPMWGDAVERDLQQGLDDE